MTLRLTLVAALAALTFASCEAGKGVDGTYCIADAGKLVFKDGKVSTDAGDAAGAYKADASTVVFTDKFGLPKTFNREKDGSLSGDFRMTPCK